MDQKMGNLIEISNVAVEEKASFPIILDFHFFNNKKY